MILYENRGFQILTLNCLIELEYISENFSEFNNILWYLNCTILILNEFKFYYINDKLS